MSPSSIQFYLLLLGKAKNLLQMWKSIDKENSPPTSRRGPRPMTPPANDERRFSSSNDVSHSLFNNQNRLSSIFFQDETVTMTEEKLPIESGYAKAIRERFSISSNHFQSKGIILHFQTFAKCRTKYKTIFQTNNTATIVLRRSSKVKFHQSFVFL